MRAGNRRRRSAVLFCSTALLCAAAALPAAAQDQATEAAPPPVAVRAMTFNIRAGSGEDGVFDIARTSAAIAAQHPDVVALEEVDVHWGARSDWQDEATRIARATGMRVFFAPIYSLDPPQAGAPREEFGVALLSRHPILSAVNHQLTRLSTQVANPVPAPAPGFPEIVTEIGGALVHVYGTHLDYRADPSVRRLQVADTLRILDEDHGEQQVLMGDLNATPNAPELAPLLDRLTDAWAVTHPGDPGLTYPAGVPAERIDYVLVSHGVGVRGAAVPVTEASDHRPVVADLTAARGR
ncbi:endonuclease/exonuclease/phosphatase family protein [Actinacidiphila rubida]|uniref:Metal-dependent hydrolase, endonuclease/exonuclease/phosphatase family n=1 Tax=Actinacidiphila rubida TaxID=310780 RepID=A0A1H8KTZ5_9ACTN|nr:endonuclease/exonuclease/phosphatase family protein [Actinacidiphila rubida]SEN96291.1 Metal-dependent hydrolase, endonuclease/exonuclease/phosphatase family [Actinacidiphila rubida]